MAKKLHHRGHLSPRRLTTVGATALAVLALSLPMPADATPSLDDINQAKAAEEVAKMSVAQIEVELASVSAAADTAMQNAMIAGEALNQAQIELDQAKETTQKAKEQAAEAQTNFEEGRRELAAVAQTAYRDGNSSLDPLAPYLSSDGLDEVEQKQQIIDQFGSAADAKMQRVTALQQVAKITANAADQAEKQQEAATEQVQKQTDAANTAASQAQELEQTTVARRDVLVQELAKRQNTTVELINQREADLAAQRAAAEQKAAEERAAAIAAANAQAAAAAAAQQAASSASSSSSSTTTSSSSASSTSTTTTSRSDTRSSTSSSSTSTSSTSGSGGAAAAIAYAKSKIGAPYVWAAGGPWAFDCSGLTSAAWAAAGVSIPHYSKSQYNYGTKIPFNQRQPGDLIFWSDSGSASGIYHVAISLGGNSMIEAPAPGYSVHITTIWGWSQIMPYVVRL